MKNNATKEKLMEMLVKLNPSVLNEIAPPAAPVTPTAAPVTPTAAPVAKPVSSDNKAYAKQMGMSYGVKSSGSRINTATEFPQAFKDWFAGLGYDPQNQAISTSKVLTDIRTAMAEMGYK